MTIRERVAKALGWTLDDTKTVSFQSLRDLVRPVDPKLAEELSRLIEGGQYLR